MGKCWWMVPAAVISTLTLGRGAETGFTQGPAVQIDDEQAHIAFTVSASTDVEVAILDARGAVVRHLAAGRLADHAGGCALAWDQKDDAGQAAAGRPFSVRVRLGLGHVLDRVIGWDPKAIRKVYSVAVGPKGEVFVLWAQPYDVNGPPQVCVLSREGKYLRTIVPYPANLAGDMAGVNPLRLPDGSVQPRVYQAFASTFYPFLSGACRQTMTVAGNRLVLANGWFNYSASASCGPRRLLAVGLDGRCPESFARPLLDRSRVEGYVALAPSPDGRMIYATGLYSTDDWAKEHKPYHCVFRAAIQAGADALADVFFGEKGVAGADEAHLNNPCGLAADAGGNVYVADYGNHRIVKLDPSGKYVGVAKVDSPDALALNRKTGALYVLAVDHGSDTIWSGRGWQRKKVIKLASFAEPLVVATIDGFREMEGLTLAVDDQATPPVLWLASAFPGTYHGSGRGLFRIEDRGASFGPAECVLGPESKPDGLVVCEYLTVNPVNEQLHVRGDEGAAKWYVFDGRSGRRVPFPALREGGEERAFDSEGRLYCYGSGLRHVLFRYDRDGRAAPFSGTRKNVIDTLSGGLKSRPRGFTVGRDGDIYILHYPGDPWKPDGMRTTVTVCGQDGTVKRTDVIQSMRTAAGIRVDRQGNLYVAENLKDPAGPLPAEFAIPADGGPRGKMPGARDLSRYDPAAWYPWMYGGVVKFPPTGGRIELNASGQYLTGWPGWEKLENGYRGQTRVKATGAEWVRGWAAPMPAVGQTCVCGAARFDLDDFGRLYLPDAGRSRVNVLDAAGNHLTHFGTYGNVDSPGAVPAPAIPLAWPGCVAASPEAIYVSDWLNLRVLRVRQTCTAEKTCALP